MRRLARSAQRVVVLRTAVGTALRELAREFHAHSPQAREALLSLDAEQFAREEDSGAPYEAARRGRVALLEPQRAPESIQRRLAQRLQRWRRSNAAAPRVLALFAGEPHGLSPELSDALDGLSLRLAPLAERPADLAAYARGHLANLGVEPARLTDDALHVLEALPWEGGERELELWLERALVLCGEGPLLERHVTPPVLPWNKIDGSAPSEPSVSADRSLATVESDWIRRVLAEQGGNVSRCAELLGIHRSTLHAKLRALGVR